MEVEQEAAPTSGGRGEHWARRRGHGARTLLALVAAALAGMLAAVAGAQAASGPPMMLAVPMISGVPQVGQPLTASPGSWTGEQPILFQYQWLRCSGAGGSCVPIAAAGASAYVPSPDDLGHRLRVSVIAMNQAGSAQAVSAASGIVGASQSQPQPSLTPMDKADCKHGGWRRFTNPSFRNQGQCVSFAVHSGHARHGHHGRGGEDR